MKISKLPDEELIFFLTLQESSVKPILERRYLPRFNYLACKYSKNADIPKDAIYNVCLMTLAKAIEKREENNYSICSYWNKITVNELNTVIDEYKKNEPPRCLSIDDYFYSNGSLVSLENVIGNENKYTSNQLLYDVLEIIKKPSFAMDFEEKDILTKYLIGYRGNDLYNEFPKLSKSMVYRIVQKGKTMLQRHLKDCVSYNAQKSKN